MFRIELPFATGEKVGRGVWKIIAGPPGAKMENRFWGTDRDAQRHLEEQNEMFRTLDEDRRRRRKLWKAAKKVHLYGRHETGPVDQCPRCRHLIRKMWL